MPPPTGAGFEWEYFHVNSAEITAGRQLPDLRPQHVGGLQDRPPHGQDHLEAWAARTRPSSSARACASTGSTAPASRPTARCNIYDNSAAPPTRKNSRVLSIRLDEQAKTATLVKALKHPLGLLSSSQGNVETLPNGNPFVGWGSQRWFTEFDAQGNVVFDGRLARGNDNYRAFRYPWVGTPSTPPKVVATAGSGKVTAPCELERRDRGRPVGAARRPEPGRARPARLRQLGGFETAVTANGAPALVALRAYDAAGNVLATSKPVKPGS